MTIPSGLESNAEDDDGYIAGVQFLYAAIGSRVGMLRLRRSFASLHSGSAQHDNSKWPREQREG